MKSSLVQSFGHRCLASAWRRGAKASGQFQAGLMPVRRWDSRLATMGTRSSIRNLRANLPFWHNYFDRHFRNSRLALPRAGHRGLNAVGSARLSRSARLAGICSQSMQIASWLLSTLVGAGFETVTEASNHHPRTKHICTDRSFRSRLARLESRDQTSCAAPPCRHARPVSQPRWTLS